MSPGRVHIIENYVACVGVLSNCYGYKMKNLSCLVMYCLLLLCLASCARTPIKVVEQDIKTYLENKYNEPFKIIEYTQLLSNEGNGFSDQHVLKSAPISDPKKELYIKIRYEDNKIKIFDDRYYKYSKHAIKKRAEIQETLEKYTSRFAFRLDDSGIKIFNNREDLKNYKLDNEGYQFVYSLLISLFEKQPDFAKRYPRLYNDLVSKFTNNNTRCLFVVIKHHPTSSYKAEFTNKEILDFYETRTLRTGAVLEPDILNNAERSPDDVTRKVEIKPVFGCYLYMLH